MEMVTDLLGEPKRHSVPNKIFSLVELKVATLVILDRDDAHSTREL